MEDPWNNDQYIQNQCVLVTQTQTTAQRPPACNLVKVWTEQGGGLIMISFQFRRSRPQRKNGLDSPSSSGRHF